jgi:hypothetical protein
MEKIVGGLAIIDTRTGNKEKPSAAEVYLRLDELNQKWGKKHLRVVGNELEVLGDNNQSVVKIFIENEKERQFLHNFYGI